MSWHPSRASTEALDPAVPSRYRAAVVRGCAGRSMLVETEDGDERLVALPFAPLWDATSLVGARVLLADGDEWVAAIDPGDPAEAVVIDLGDGSRAPEIDVRPGTRQGDEPPKGPRSFASRVARSRRRSWVRAHLG